MVADLGIKVLIMQISWWIIVIVFIVVLALVVTTLMLTSGKSFENMLAAIGSALHIG